MVFLDQFVYHFLFHSSIDNFDLGFKKTSYRFMIGQIIVDLAIINIHEGVLLGQIMDTLKKYPISVCRHPISIILVGLDNILISGSKSDAPLAIISKNALFILGLLAKLDPFVIPLECLDIILRNQLHGLIHV